MLCFEKKILNARSNTVAVAHYYKHYATSFVLYWKDHFSLTRGKLHFHFHYLEQKYYWKDHKLQNNTSLDTRRIFHGILAGSSATGSVYIHGARVGPAWVDDPPPRLPPAAGPGPGLRAPPPAAACPPPPGRGAPPPTGAPRLSSSCWRQHLVAGSSCSVCITVRRSRLSLDP